uniref:C2H2-type domain-containing protein n=1 Tax=Glossina brevipalpis TaxID=37001 RepID=A0A1A9X2H0_9MUSC
MDENGKNLCKSSAFPILMFNYKNQSAQQQQQFQPVSCIKCDIVFNFPLGKDDFLGHLFLAHRLVIADVEEIAFLEEYLEYWQKEFKYHEFEEYCTTMLLDQLPDGTFSKNEKYYLLSDILPKDRELRNKLTEKRLETVLSQHQYELTDRNFQRECLYCRDVISGLRSTYIEHLFSKHFLQLGKPENLVFIDEMIAKVANNLEKLICLYCEKVFKDRATLKEHMRKKGHKRVNPNNRSYDKYFLENYRSTTQVHDKKHLSYPQKRKQKLTNKNQDGETSCPLKDDESIDFKQNIIHHSEEDSDSDWSDWNGESLQTLTCLYCTEQCKDFTIFKQHVLAKHSLDFDDCLKGLNFYQRIKMVNYVRRQTCLHRCVTCNRRFEDNNELLQHLGKETHYGVGGQKQWDKPEYFFPTYEDDGLLCLLDDNPNDDIDDTVVRIISEETVANINKDAEKLSLENFNFL